MVDRVAQQERYGADLATVSKASQAKGPYQPKSVSRLKSSRYSWCSTTFEG